MTEDKDQGEELEQVHRTIRHTLAKPQALDEEPFGIRLPTPIEGDRLHELENHYAELARVYLNTSRRVGDLADRVARLEEAVRKLGGHV